jgi:chromosome segregation ATPase
MLFKRKIIFISLLFFLSAVVLVLAGQTEKKEEIRIKTKRICQDIKVLNQELIEVQEEIERSRSASVSTGEISELEEKAVNKKKQIEKLEMELKECEERYPGIVNKTKEELQKREVKIRDKENEIRFLEEELTIKEKMVEVFLNKKPAPVSEIESLQKISEEIRQRIKILRQELKEFQADR